MDFLHPTALDNDRAILLLLVSRNGETHISCYDWNTMESLRSISTKSIGRKLPYDCSLPSILIPLKRTTSFLLVAPSCMLIYTNILDPDETASPVRHPMHNPDGKDPPDGRIWTFWARPIRNSRRFDDIFLCREDGKTLYLEIGSGGEILRMTQPGQLGCKVDTAFASVDGGYKAGDLLVAVGNMSDGGLFVADARQPPRCVQHIANWAPILDSTTVAARDPQGPCDDNGQIASTPHDRIFACSAAGAGHGSITELRYGIEVRIGLMIDQDEASSIMNIWAIPNLETGATFLLLSGPLSSLLICVPVDAEELEEVDAESSGLDLGAPTLAAATTADGVAIQVTNSSINLSMMGSQTLVKSSKCRDPAERIIAASANGRLSLVATGIRNGDDVRVEIWKVDANENGLQCNLVGDPLALSQEPVCLTVAGLDSHSCLFIGTSDGRVLGSWIGDGGSAIISQHAIDFPVSSGDSTACESMCIITTQGHGLPRYTLFCGLRSGSLFAFGIEPSSEMSSPGRCLSKDTSRVHHELTTGLALGLKQIASHKLGDTPVRIRGFEYNPSIAIASCGSGLWRLSAIESRNPQQYAIHNVWITDQNNVSRSENTLWRLAVS